MLELLYDELLKLFSSIGNNALLSVVIFIVAIIQVGFFSSLIVWPLKESIIAKLQKPAEPKPEPKTDAAAEGKQQDGENKAEAVAAAATGKTNFYCNLLQTLKKSKKNKEKKKKR